MTRGGRHAAGRPPSRILPLIAAVFPLALAAGGWSLFARTPSGAEPFALAGDQAQMALPSVRSVTADPGAPRRDPRPARSGGASSDRGPTAVEGSDPLAFPELITPPRVPTVVVPSAGARRREPEAELPELLPKTTAELGRIADSAAGLASRLKGTDLKITELNWTAVAGCVSSNDPKAVGPDGSYGLYRLTPKDWESVGGTGLPNEASPEEQTRRAQLLYAREGGEWQTLWPKCGSLLFLK